MEVRVDRRLKGSVAPAGQTFPATTSLFRTSKSGRFDGVIAALMVAISVAAQVVDSLFA
jgi:hypothetical protein